MGFPGGAMVGNPLANTGDTRDVDLIPGSVRFPGVGNGNPLQYSFLENSMDGGAWQTTVYSVAKSWTQLSMHTSHHTRLYANTYPEKLFQWHHGLILLGLIQSRCCFSTWAITIENGKVGAFQLKFNGWPLGCTWNWVGCKEQGKEKANAFKVHHLCVPCSVGKVSK